uniref:Aldedh domain-containing protein n=1 Tax=Globodera pallida TaxID=36090 RepID=A0A183BHQ9_GLOPA
MNPNPELFKLSVDISAGLHFFKGKRQNICASSGSQFAVIEPSTGAIVAQCPNADDALVDIVVNQAEKVQPSWAAMSPLERSKVLLRTATLIRANLETIASWETRTNGKPIVEARVDIESSADTFAFYGGILPAEFKGDFYDLPTDGQGNRFAYTRREPFGVVGCIGAWNYPFQTCCWKVAPALAAGNAVVYKPSPFAPGSPVLLGELLKAAVGTFCKVTLELGGKSAFIVFEDANLQDAVASAILANFCNQGEVCTNATRVFVQESVLNSFQTKLLTELESKMRVGNPLEDSTNPAVLTNLDDDMEIVKEEIFGAVMLILPFQTEEEAVSRANATQFGLASGLCTTSLARAHRVAAQLKVGTVFVNTYNDAEVHIPFGGFKNSGHGRENCVECLHEYSQVKAVYMHIGEGLQHNLG